MNEFLWVHIPVIPEDDILHFELQSQPYVHPPLPMQPFRTRVRAYSTPNIHRNGPPAFPGFPGPPGPPGPPQQAAMPAAPPAPPAPPAQPAQPEQGNNAQAAQALGRNDGPFHVPFGQLGRNNEYMFVNARGANIQLSRGVRNPFGNMNDMGPPAQVDNQGNRVWMVDARGARIQYGGEEQHIDNPRNRRQFRDMGPFGPPPVEDRHHQRRQGGAGRGRPPPPMPSNGNSPYLGETWAEYTYRRDLEQELALANERGRRRARSLGSHPGRRGGRHGGERWTGREWEWEDE